MNKQELIQIHQLLMEVANHADEEFGAELDLSEYEDNHVSATAIHKKKTQHVDAISALSTIVAEGAQEAAEEDEKSLTA